MADRCRSAQLVRGLLGVFGVDWCFFMFCVLGYTDTHLLVGRLRGLEATVVGRRAGFAIGEEVAQHQHLADADREDAERFDDGPPEDSFVDVFGAFAAWWCGRSFSSLICN